MITVNGIAERFGEVFQRHFWEPYVSRGMPAEEMPSLMAAVKPANRTGHPRRNS